MSKSLSEIEAEIYEAGSVNRIHLLDFLALQDTSDQAELRRRVEDWLNRLHHDQHFSKVQFTNSPLQDEGPIRAIISDLTTYGHVQAQTIHEAHDPEPEEEPEEKPQILPHQPVIETPEPVNNEEDDLWKPIG